MKHMLDTSWLPPVIAQVSERLVSTISEFNGTASVWVAVTGSAEAAKPFS